MTAALIALAAMLAVAVVWLGVLLARAHGPRTPPPPDMKAARILFPFVADALSPRALDAALLLARSEDATLVPVFLARVSLRLPLDAPLPRQSNIAITMQEAIEQRAAAFEVPVDARIERGRTYRQALRRTLEHEQFDRIVIAASDHTQPGFNAEDVAWLIDANHGELIILRPDPAREVAPPARRRQRNGREHAVVAAVSAS